MEVLLLLRAVGVVLVMAMPVPETGLFTKLVNCPVALPVTCPGIILRVAVK